jgi:hypothetical protein
LHTTGIDAAGAIYVLGGIGSGSSSYTYYRDVWVSTNGGAQPDTRGYSQGTLRGTYGKLSGTPTVTVL